LRSANAALEAVSFSPRTFTLEYWPIFQDVRSTECSNRRVSGQVPKPQTQSRSHGCRREKEYEAREVWLCVGLGRCLPLDMQELLALHRIPLWFRREDIPRPNYSRLDQEIKDLNLYMNESSRKSVESRREIFYLHPYNFPVVS
jgi:hypothetical protein